jgi:hypothetical protein
MHWRARGFNQGGYGDRQKTLIVICTRASTCRHHPHFKG